MSGVKSYFFLISGIKLVSCGTQLHSLSNKGCIMGPYYLELYANYI